MPTYQSTGLTSRQSALAANVAAYVSLVIDRSESMSSLRSKVIEATNKLIADQQKTGGQAFLSLATFGGSVSMVADAVPVAQIQPLTEESYAPFGGTALNDGVGLSIQAIGKHAVRRSRVLIAIVTDGEENSSRQFSISDVRDMVGYRRASHDWQFIFIGPASSFSYARKIEIPDRNIVELDSDIGQLLDRLSKAVGEFLLGDSRYVLRLHDKT